MSNTRRTFLKRAGQVSAVGLLNAGLYAQSGLVVILLDPEDSVTGSVPVRWAAEHLRSHLEAKSTAAAIVRWRS